jgi:hypothetical protein
MSMKLLVTLERDETGMLIAECPAIPGCVSSGEHGTGSAGEHSGGDHRLPGGPRHQRNASHHRRSRG